MAFRWIFSLGGLLILVCLPAAAATFYVSTTGTDDSSCLNPLDPCRTIQFAYDNLPLPYLPAHEIRVAPGTYNECLIASGYPFVNKPVRIVSEAWLLQQDRTQTILDGTGICDGAGVGATVTLGGTGARLEGFTVRGGGDSGVDAVGGVVITNNLITGNQSVQGGGIYLYSATCYYAGDVQATISNNTVTGNTSEETLGDGAGIWVWAAGFQPSGGCLGGGANVTVQGNLVTNNIAQNTNPGPFSLGAGVGVLINPNTLPGGGAPAPAGTARVVVTQNTITGNTSAAGSYVFGGGVWAGTYYAGDWTVEITDNTITDNAASANGGGISTHFDDFRGDHTILIEGNTVANNTSEASGGGMDLFAILNLATGDIFSLQARNNTVTGNACSALGGGIFAEFKTDGSLESADLPLFPTHPAPAAEITFAIESNSVSGNTAFLGGGGVALQTTANGDPDSLPPTLCSDTVPAVARVRFTNNFVHDNVTDTATLQLWGRPGCSDLSCESVVCGFDSFCCDVVWDGICASEAVDEPACTANCAEFGGDSNCCGAKEVNGTGVLILTEALGPAIAAVDIETSTILSNEIVDIGFVGGIEIASLSRPDCAFTETGESRIAIDRSIVVSNDIAGIGGPPHAPDDRLTVDVTRSSVFGNSGPQQYENTIFPAGTPAGNILADPQVDLLTGFPQVCSPAFRVGTCAADPRICLDDNGCKTCSAGANAGQPCTINSNCPGGACTVVGNCVPEGAGYIASPDSNDDARVDGIDILDLAVAFGTSKNDPPVLPDPRYDSSADLDRNGIVDGNDLSFMSSVFAEVCP